MEIIEKYFPGLSEEQVRQFSVLDEIYRHWNARINLISRREIDFLYERHVLHSLGIAKMREFPRDTRVLDVGTGGGFPAVPLAILFPRVRFTAVDSIAKKVAVVEDVIARLGLENVEVRRERAEEMSGKFDYITCRAVTAMPRFVAWVEDKVDKGSTAPGRGIYALKGGDLKDEMKALSRKYTIYSLADYFEEDFFEEKKVVYTGV